MAIEPSRREGKGAPQQAVVLPEFKSTIPPHLLAALPEDERFVVDTVSKLENQAAWLAREVVQQGRAVETMQDQLEELTQFHADTLKEAASRQEVEQQVKTLVLWKERFVARWALPAAAALAIAASLLKVGVEFLVGLFKRTP